MRPDDVPVTTSSPSRTNPVRPLLSGRWVWSSVVLLSLVISLLRFAYFVFHDRADGMTGRLDERLFTESTGGIVTVLFVVLLVLFAQRTPPPWQSWKRGVLTCAAEFVAFTIGHTFAMILLRAVAAPMFGMSGYEMHLQLSRFVYEAANDVFPFVAVVASFSLAEVYVEQRNRDRRAAALERGLLESELRNLRLQLQPHFLFNALNTISSTMYDDPAAADALLGGLAELLRTSLRTTHAHEVTVHEELALLEQYLGLMHARFGDRLTVSVSHEGGVDGCMVPSMILQPLVENAVQHGAVARGEHGEVNVTVRRFQERAGSRDMLELRVHDNGPGVRDGMIPPTSGTGLSTTDQRLRLLYGDDQSMSAANAPEGGFAVTLLIPARCVAHTVELTKTHTRVGAIA